MAVCFVLRLFLTFAAALKVFVRPTVIGRPENIPTEGPVIFAFNHQAPPFDIVAYFGALKTRKDLAFLATSGLFIWPVGPILKWMGHIPVRRGTEAAKDAADAGTTSLRAGAAIAISFEGGSSPADGLRYPKKGTARMAQETGAAVVPVIGVGLDRVKPRGTSVLHWRFGQRYVIMIGQPVPRPEDPDLTGLSAEEVEAAKKAWRDAMSDNLYQVATEMVKEGTVILAEQDGAALAKA